MGPEVQAFEQELAAFLGVGPRDSRCRAARRRSHLAYLALGIGAGDEVDPAGAQFRRRREHDGGGRRHPGVCRHRRARRADHRAAPRSSALITPRTRAVVAMHYGGYPAGWPSSPSICARAWPGVDRRRLPRHRARAIWIRRSGTGRGAGRERRRYRLFLVLQQQEPGDRRGRPGRHQPAGTGRASAPAALARHDHADVGPHPGQAPAPTTWSRTASTTGSTNCTRALESGAEHREAADAGHGRGRAGSSSTGQP